MRVLVIINKWWECDPALAAMLDDNARPPKSPWPDDLRPTRPRPELAEVPNANPVPRATFRYKTFAAEVWCLSDLLDGLSTIEQSSSEQKAKRLQAIFTYGCERPGIVIAVGTASTPDPGVNFNGGVVVGTRYQVFGIAMAIHFTTTHASITQEAEQQFITSIAAAQMSPAGPSQISEWNYLSTEGRLHLGTS